MRTRRFKTAAASVALLVIFAGPAVDGAEADSEIVCHVEKHGESFVVDVAFDVKATQSEAWHVLTDFDHMHEFVSNLESSKVMSRRGNQLEVAQSGKASRGMLSFSFHAVRAVELQPIHLIRTKVISGDMKKLDGRTVLRADAGVTHVQYHGESTPNMWVPAAIASKFIQSEVQEQYREMRNEILRRKARTS